MLVGLVAMYCNDPTRQQAFISHVSTLADWQGQGIAAHLLEHAIQHARVAGMANLQLEVAADNAAAIQLYRKHGFTQRGETQGMTLIFNLPLCDNNKGE